MTAPSPYPAPAGPADAEITIKYSRFLAALRPVTSRAEVQDALAEIRAAHPTASHHCYAYLIGSPRSGEAAMSDDGEPSGTAGRPIFTVIGHKGLGDVLVVVTRYFGGVKLGAGGLVRAYMAAAEAVLSRAPVTEALPVTAMTLRCDFGQEQVVRHFCGEHGGAVSRVDYGSAVTMALTVPVDAIPALRSLCAVRGMEIVAEA